MRRGLQFWRAQLQKYHTRMVSVDKTASINLFKRVSSFWRGIVSPNSHTDFEYIDKISARPHLDCKIWLKCAFDYILIGKIVLLGVLDRILLEKMAFFWRGGHSITKLGIDQSIPFRVSTISCNRQHLRSKYGNVGNRCTISTIIKSIRSFNFMIVNSNLKECIFLCLPVSTFF